MKTSKFFSSKAWNLPKKILKILFFVLYDITYIQNPGNGNNYLNLPFNKNIMRYFFKSMFHNPIPCDDAFPLKIFDLVTFTVTFDQHLKYIKSKLQKNWYTVTVAPAIDYHGGHSRTPANQRWDQVPGRSQHLLLG